MRIRISLGVIALLTVTTAAQDFSINPSTGDGGGGTSTGGALRLDGTIGQPDAGPVQGSMTGGSFALLGGYWPGTISAAAVPGDCDGSGEIGLADLAELTFCMLGPSGGLGEGCACADFDSDGEVTLMDVAQLQLQFTAD